MNTDADKTVAELIRAQLNYDPATGVFTRRVAAHCQPVGAVAGGVGAKGYVFIRVCGKRHRAHHLAWLCVHGKWPSRTIDHINGIKTDNRIANLRDVPDAINSQNLRIPRSHNKSGILGAHQTASGKQWQSILRVDGVKHYLGTFNTPQEAHVAYVEAKRRLHVGNTL